MLKNAKSFLVFSLVGATGAGLYFLALAVQLEVLAIDYRVAVTIAYLFCVIFNFLANKLLTFKKRELSDTTSQFFRYVAVAAFSYALTMAITVFTVERLHYSPYIGAIASLAVTMVAHYLLSKHWVFAQAESRK